MLSFQALSSLSSSSIVFKDSQEIFVFLDVVTKYSCLYNLFSMIVNVHSLLGAVSWPHGHAPVASVALPGFCGDARLYLLRPYVVLLHASFIRLRGGYAFRLGIPCNRLEQGQLDAAGGHILMVE
jgi:hypothetical protein